MSQRAALDLDDEAAVTVAACMAAGRCDTLPNAAAELVRRGADAGLLLEAAYVGSLFCGFPAGVAALSALAGLRGRIRRDRAAPDRSRLRERGERQFRRIHRHNAARQLEMLETLHPDFADTVLVEAYGRVLSRRHLPLPRRELIGVVVLAVLGLERQLRAHLLAAGNVGVPPAAIADALALAATLAGRDLAPAVALARELALTAGSPPAPRAASARPSSASRGRRARRP